MANVQNSFIRSKLNKDLDARLLPNGEYRDATNVQVSRSDGSNVGSLENILGNENIKDFSVLTGDDSMVCIGKVVSEPTNEVYLFLTSYTDPNPSQLNYSPSGENYIVVYNSILNKTTILVQGNFLNFSTTHEIYHANLLEGLLFWTDNRNQPRKINVNVANPSALTTPTYYTTEDQISVAKYNPFQPIQLWQENTASSSTIPYESTMKDVTSKIFPNGAIALTGAGTNYPGAGTNKMTFSTLTGEVPMPGDYTDLGATVGYVDANGNIVPIGTVATIAYGLGSEPLWTVTLASPAVWPAVFQPAPNPGIEVVFNANTYYDKNFAGDPNFLEDKFARFSYRFKFDDNEYSLMAPFTQVAFIPKQDGYFMYVQNEYRNYTSKDDQAAAYRSTVVSFVENKVDAIKLLIPLPFPKSTISKLLKITELDILYKESDALAIKVIETINIADLTSGTDSSIFQYDYLSKKPYKVLPSSDTTRVYDRVPVRAFAQEVSGNRVIYGNFQTKHTPPVTLDYNVAIDAKANFNLQTGTAVVDGAQNIAANTDFDISTWTPFEAGSVIETGMIVSISSTGVVIGTVSLVTSNSIIQLNAAVDLANGVGLTFNPAGPDAQTVSKIEYPNHSLKQNRNYQVGVVLSDRYGRTSTVILSRSNSLINGFRGDTIYSPYIGTGTEQDSWPGESLKMLFNSVIGPSTKNVLTGEPGLYNGLTSSIDYNPLGWYSYKIVVKQTEQEYYNVYLPGIMASYPERQLLELGKTSHAVLLNDNINKVPRDLTEVGPDQRQFRSSVQLFGRVENTSVIPAYAVNNEATPPAPDPAVVQDLTNAGALTDQYYPGTNSDTVSTISTLSDLFDYNQLVPPVPNYFPQFYLSESNPLIARISTSSKIGQTALTNYGISSALVATVTVPNVTQGFTDIELKNIISNNPPAGDPILANDIITAPGVPKGTVTVTSFTAASAPALDTIRVNALVTLAADEPISMVPGFPPDFLSEPKPPGIQYLAVYETEPVESLLDIFWESTSAGEVNELNTLILNATGGGAGLINTSTSDWDEAYGTGATIFNNNFSVVDSFNTIILPATTPPTPGVFLTSLLLTGVTNGNNENVQGNMGPYFQLDNLGSGLFNISLMSKYFDAVYFSPDPGECNFRFTIEAETTDGTTSTTNTYIINAGPSNITPLQANPSITTVPSLSGSTIHSNRFVENISVCKAANGSGNPLLKAGGTSWILRSAYETGGFSNYASGADLAGPGVTQPLFSVSNSDVIVGGNTLAQGIVKINQQPVQPLPGKYLITVGVQDAGGEPPAGTNFTFTLDLVIVPTQVYYQYYTWCSNPQGSSPCPQGDEEDGYIVVIEITTSTIPTVQNGFYIFDIGDTSFDSWANGNTGTITIDRTNAATTTTGSNIPSSIPAYGGDGAASYQNAFDIIDTRNFNSEGVLTPGQQNPDISENVFQIV